MGKEGKEKEYLKFEQKVALSRRVENLPENEHPNIYRIIRARDPSTLQDSEDPNWAYVLFHLLRPSTLRELESYLASRDVNTQSEIRENNPDVESKESPTKSAEYTDKLRSRKGSKSDAGAAGGSKSEAGAAGGSKSDAGAAGGSKSDAGAAGGSKSDAEAAGGSKSDAGAAGGSKSDAGVSGSKSDTGAKSESIKTRLRKTSKKIDAGSSKQA